MPWFLIANLRGIVGDNFVQITSLNAALSVRSARPAVHLPEKKPDTQTSVSPEEMQLNLHKERGHANLNWEAWIDAKLGRHTVAGISSWGQVQLISWASDDSVIGLQLLFTICPLEDNFLSWSYKMSQDSQ